MNEELSRYGVPEIRDVPSFLRQIRQGVKETHEITIRGLSIPVRVLSMDELQEIRATAKQECAKIRGDQLDQDLICEKLTLSKASTVPKNGTPLLAAPLLSELSADEINFLYNELMVVFDRVNPALDVMTEAELRAIKEEIKKKTITPKDLSLRQLRAIFLDWQALITQQDS